MIKKLIKPLGIGAIVVVIVGAVYFYKMTNGLSPAGDEGLLQPQDATTETSQPNSQIEPAPPQENADDDLSKMVKDVVKLDPADDIVLEGWIHKVGNATPSQYLLRVRLDSDPPEIKPITLILPDETMLDPLYENQSPQLADGGLRFYVRGKLIPIVGADSDQPEWAMEAKRVVRWVYIDPCTNYVSSNKFTPFETLPESISNSKPIMAAIEKICPNFMGETGRRDWILMDPENLKELTFIYGCEKDLDEQTDGFGVYHKGKKLKALSQSIDDVIPKDNVSACWLENMDRYFEAELKKVTK